MRNYIRAFFAAGVAAALVSGALALLFASLHAPPEPVALPGIVVGIAVAGFVLVRSGTRAVVLAPAAERDAARALVPPPGAALLVVARRTATGKALGVDLALDGTTVAQLRSGRFFACPLPPKRHRLTATLGHAPKSAVALDLDVAAGEVHACRVDNRFGLVAGLALVPLPRAEAQALLAGLELVRPPAPA